MAGGWPSEAAPLVIKANSFVAVFKSDGSNTSTFAILYLIVHVDGRSSLLLCCSLFLTQSLYPNIFIPRPPSLTLWPSLSSNVSNDSLVTADWGYKFTVVATCESSSNSTSSVSTVDLEQTVPITC
jgi:hypothetical protein